jgi:hypothetical protein
MQIIILCCLGHNDQEKVGMCLVHTIFFGMDFICGIHGWEALTISLGCLPTHFSLLILLNFLYLMFFNTYSFNNSSENVSLFCSSSNCILVVVSVRI